MIDTPQQNTVEIPCPICHRTFKSMTAVRIHHLRMHTKGWDTSSNFKNRRGPHSGISGTKAKGKIETPQEREHRLALKRRYQRTLRDRYYREGKDSRGQQRPEGWVSRQRPRTSTVSIHKDPEAMREYKRNWWKNKKAASRPLIVYPDNTQDTQENNTQTTTIMKYCPECGTHLEAWRKE